MKDIAQSFLDWIRLLPLKRGAFDRTHDSECNAQYLPTVACLFAHSLINSLSAERKSSRAAMERSGIAVRWSALLGVSTPAAISFSLDVASRLNAGTNREPVPKELVKRYRTPFRA